MKITNKHNLPDALVRAVENDDYSKGDSDFSATELIKPSRIWALEQQHKDEITEDVIDRIWALLGSSVHAMIERANSKDIVEVRYGAEFLGKKVSAQIDSLSVDSGVLSDFKVSSVYSFMEPKPEWIAQMNMQCEILRRNNIDVTQLQIVGIIRDFQQSKVGTYNYPELPVKVVPIEMWERDKTVEYINSRIKSHLEALKSLPLCSDSDRWAKAPKWAAMKPGKKTALKLFDTKQDAQTLADEVGGHVEVRNYSGTKRCEKYCPVAKFCSQYQSLKEENIQEESMSKPRSVRRV